MTGLLLDTCVLVWAVAEPERLPSPARAGIVDPARRVCVSTASLWELVLKQAKGALRWSVPPGDTVGFFLEQCAAHRFEVLIIEPAVLQPLERLPTHHRDPFDRLLVAQAITEGLGLVTPDPMIHRYPVATHWA